MPLDINGHTLPTDKEGYLVDLNDWSEDAARALARLDGIELTPAHWEILHFLRSYYAEYRIIPTMRPLTKAIERELGPDKGNSRYLYRLFPDGPIKQGTRYAGLPKPPHCI